MKEDQIKNELQNLRNLLEMNLQQKSGHHSDLLNRILVLDKKVDDNYSKGELDLKIENITQSLAKILVQTTMHNGRMTKMERYMLVIACVVGTTMVLYFPQILTAIKLFL